MPPIDYAAAHVADQATAAAWLQQLDAITDPVARLVLDLHRRDPHGAAYLCGSGESAYYEATWPCETVLAVADLFGIPAPDMQLGHVPVVED